MELVRMQGLKVAKSEEFKYLGSTVTGSAEEKRADRVEWAERSVSSDLQQKGTSKSGREGLQE